MTGYTVHTGSSEQFSEGWDRIFSGSKKTSKKKASGKPQSAPAAKKTASKGKGKKKS